MGKEEYVPGGLTPTCLTLLSLCYLCRHARGGEGNGYPEENRQLPRNKVAANLLKDVQIRQY